MIKVQNLSKTFGEVKAVADVTFEVQPGEIFAFLGPNGAGKTTTIQMLTTLLRPTSGTIAIDGLDPVAKPLEVRKRFGIVFQDPSLDQELTAYENMDLHGVLYHVPRKLRTERIETLLKLFELWDRRTSLVKTFSGGMRRRLEIARGLLHTPKILFLDEPTLGLDPQSRNQLWTHVKHLNETGGRHGLPHDALHGRGRSRRAARRGDRPRQDRRDRLERRAQGADGRGFARGRVPEAHGHDDPRRGGGQRGRRCGKWRGCGAGGSGDERDLRVVAARGEALSALAAADHRVARPAASVSARARLRARPRHPDPRNGELPAVRRARRDLHGHPVHVDLLRDRPALGSAVRISRRRRSSPRCRDCRSWPVARSAARRSR